MNISFRDIYPLTRFLFPDVTKEALLTLRRDNSIRHRFNLSQLALAALLFPAEHVQLTGLPLTSIFTPLRDLDRDVLGEALAKTNLLLEQKQPSIKTALQKISEIGHASMIVEQSAASDTEEADVHFPVVTPNGGVTRASTIEGEGTPKVTSVPRDYMELIYLLSCLRQHYLSLDWTGCAIDRTCPEKIGTIWAHVMNLTPHTEEEDVHPLIHRETNRRTQEAARAEDLVLVIVSVQPSIKDTMTSITGSLCSRRLFPRHYNKDTGKFSALLGESAEEGSPRALPQVEMTCLQCPDGHYALLNSDQACKEAGVEEVESSKLSSSKPHESTVVHESIHCGITADQLLSHLVDIHTQYLPVSILAGGSTGQMMEALATVHSLNVVDAKHSQEDSAFGAGAFPTTREIPSDAKKRDSLHVVTKQAEKKIEETENPSRVVTPVSHRSRCCVIA